MREDGTDNDGKDNNKDINTHNDNPKRNDFTVKNGRI